MRIQITVDGVFKLRRRVSMRTRLLLGLLIATSGGSIYAYHFSGHSFFTIRTPFQTASPEKEALWHYDMLDREDGMCGSFEIVPFGGRTLGHELGHFFAPRGERHLRVVEFKEGVSSSMSDVKRERDLEARHFNIKTRSTTSTFESELELHPHQSTVGVGLAYRGRAWGPYWVDISAPVMRVRNKFELRENIKNSGGGADDSKGLEGEPHFGSIKDAFNSKGMRFGRIDDREHEKWGLADIELKVGWDAYNNGETHFRSYIGGVIPTGNKPHERFLFAPVVGNNRHWGVMFGGNFGFVICAYGDHLIRHEVDTQGRYLFPNDQVRSFDLKDKQWSRYMEVYAGKEEAERAAQNKDANSGTFGINAFTTHVRVKPRFATTFNTAFIYEYCNYLLAEVGYNFYGRQGESVEFKHLPHLALKHVEGKGLTTRSRTIGQNFHNDKIPLDEFKVISRRDIDENSAAHPQVIANTIYGAFGVRCKEWRWPTTFSIGASYEFSHSNGGLRRWQVWGKAAIDV